MVTLGLVWMKSKSQDVSLDDLDRQILRLLQDDAKQTYGEIGNKLNVAHSTVYDRIQKMEQAGFITKYEVIVDTEKMGIPLITAYMTITTDPKETENIANKMAKYSQVLEVATSFSEELVITAKVVAKDQAELHAFVARSIAPLPGVLRIRTAIVTRKFKEERFGIRPRKE
jgi:Lrp/AsnC family transcriptional regulator, leucine-responsive regulatory protein